MVAIELVEKVEIDPLRDHRAVVRIGRLLRSAMTKARKSPLPEKRLPSWAPIRGRVL